MGERPDVVFLIGFMGAGKTTVGRHLARLLGWDFLDLDERIVANERLGIAQIFAVKGEAYFRRLETEILASLWWPVAEGPTPTTKAAGSSISSDRPSGSDSPWRWRSAAARATPDARS